MRYTILLALLSGSLGAQSPPPNCNNPITRDVDARCSCLKDPDGVSCELAKKGFYDGKMKVEPLGPNSGMPSAYGASTSQPARPQPAKPQAARVVPLAHKDYLRFVDPNARLAMGFNFDAILHSPELIGSLLGPTDSKDASNRVMAAMKEMDHLWLSLTTPKDAVILMTGKFEQGVAANMFYAQGVQPVFLTDAHAMMVGSEPSLQAALARLAKPAAAGGWVSRRARELSADHEAWIVNERPTGSQTPGALQSVRQFALGIRLTGEVGLDGDVVADSEANAEGIAAWVDQMKASLRPKTGAGAGPLDGLTVERAGSSVRFFAKDDALVEGGPGKAAISSDFGVQLYSVLMGGFPGVPSSTVAADKLLTVKAGMKREDVLSLLGKPLSVSTIQGLDPPRETWTYQVPFGKQYSLKLESGVVTVPPK